jgi:uncharacterized protein YdeI (YjbR/CyaY-like superfamily)
MSRSLPMPNAKRRAKEADAAPAKKQKSDAKSAPWENALRLAFPDRTAWEKWLRKNHATEPEIWIQVAKVASGIQSITHSEALEIALCYGWIDGRIQPLDEKYTLRRFIPRRKDSIWSQVNRAKALQLIEEGRMQPAGLAAIEQAKANGRWHSAYQPVRDKSIPADLESALKQNAKAAAFFKLLDGKNRYAMVFRLQTTKKPELRAAKLAKFVAMLERGEKLI